MMCLIIAILHRPDKFVVVPLIKTTQIVIIVVLLVLRAIAPTPTPAPLVTHEFDWVNLWVYKIIAGFNLNFKLEIVIDSFLFLKYSNFKYNYYIYI